MQVDLQNQIHLKTRRHLTVMPLYIWQACSLNNTVFKWIPSRGYINEIPILGNYNANGTSHFRSYYCRNGWLFLARKTETSKTHWVASVLPGLVFNFCYDAKYTAVSDSKRCREYSGVLHLTTQVLVQCSLGLSWRLLQQNYSSNCQTLKRYKFNPGQYSACS